MMTIKTIFMITKMTLRLIRLSRSCRKRKIGIIASKRRYNRRKKRY